MLELRSTILHAQVVTIKLVDGRSGHPMVHSYVNVWVGDQRKEAMAIPTDNNGIASLRLTDRDDEVDIHNQSIGRGFGVIDPVVRYADSIRINVGYVLCQPRRPAYSWLKIANFSTNPLIHDGIVTPNTCGKITASPEPGQLTIFVKPLGFGISFNEPAHSYCSPASAQTPIWHAPAKREIQSARPAEHKHPLHPHTETPSPGRRIFRA